MEYTPFQNAYRNFRAEFLRDWQRLNPGEAPPIDPDHEYYLFPPGGDWRLELANPGCRLKEGQQSYMVNKRLIGRRVRVQLVRKSYDILDSPDAVEGCTNVRRKSGILSIGFGNSTQDAWLTVLRVLDQIRAPSERFQMALVANVVSRASAESLLDETNATSGSPLAESDRSLILGPSSGPLPVVSNDGASAANHAQSQNATAEPERPLAQILEDL